MVLIQQQYVSQFKRITDEYNKSKGKRKNNYDSLKYYQKPLFFGGY